MIEYSFEGKQWTPLALEWIEGVAWTAAQMINTHDHVDHVAVTFDDKSKAYFRRGRDDSPK